MKTGIRFDTKLGNITVAEEGGRITQVYFTDESCRRKFTLSEVDGQETPLLKKARTELKEYLEGTRREFDLPVSFLGTEFQKRVWEALTTIPYGETRTYKQLAEQVGSPKGFRAVGLANHNNPISIIVPCHRVVGTSGSLTGYAGGLDRKSTLLEIEGGGLGWNS